MHKILDILGISHDHPAVMSLNFFQRVDMHPDQYREGTTRYWLAGGLLGALAALREPISESSLKAWFAPIVGITKSGNLTAEEIEARWNGVAFTFAGKPKFLFNDDLKRQVLMKYPWLPTPAEVWALAEPLFNEFESMRLSLNRMLRRGMAPLPAPEEIAANGWTLEAPKVIPIRLAPPDEGVAA